MWKGRKTLVVYFCCPQCLYLYYCVIFVGFTFKRAELQQTLLPPLQWHFCGSGCSPDIFLVSDQSWFSQLSHSLRYTYLNDGSASAFAKTQTGMEKLIFLTKQSHHWGTLILMFPYILQVGINFMFNTIFEKKKSNHLRNREKNPLLKCSNVKDIPKLKHLYKRLWKKYSHGTTLQFMRYTIKP